VAEKDPLAKLSDEINRIMDEREEKRRIKEDPKGAGEALATDLREFLGEWKQARAAAAEKAKSRPRVVKDDEDDGGIFGSLFGG
jgi:predicted  nucleic acid-binding Zn-ribbon protein